MVSRSKHTRVKTPSVKGHQSPMLSFGVDPHSNAMTQSDLPPCIFPSSIADSSMVSIFTSFSISKLGIIRRGVVSGTNIERRLTTGFKLPAQATIYEARPQRSLPRCPSSSERHPNIHIHARSLLQTNSACQRCTWRGTLGLAVMGKPLPDISIEMVGIHLQLGAPAATYQLYHPYQCT